MNQRQDLVSAVIKRDRSRSRMRLVTVTVGAASLAAAGVVAYNLPAPAHTTAVKGTTTTPVAQPSAAQPSSPSQQRGDDGEGGGTVTAPSGTFGQAPAQATSGGS